MIEIFPCVPEYELERKVFLALCRCVEEYGALPWYCIVDPSAICTNAEECRKKIRYLLMETFGNYHYDSNDPSNMIIARLHWESLYHVILISRDTERCKPFSIMSPAVLEYESLFEKYIPIWKKWVEDIVLIVKTDPIHAVSTLLALRSRIAEIIDTIRLISPYNFFDNIVEYIKSHYIEGIC